MAAADAVAVELLSYDCMVVYECLDLRSVWLLVMLRRHWGRLPVSLVVVVVVGVVVVVVVVVVGRRTRAPQASYWRTS